MRPVEWIAVELIDDDAASDDDSDLDNSHTDDGSVPDTVEAGKIFGRRKRER